MKRNFWMTLFNVLISILLSSVSVQAAENTYTLVIKDHAFLPAELVVPANKKIKLNVENQDSTKEEFESFDLNREEVVGGHETLHLFIGPLKAGRYEYFGDFNPKTANGVIVAQ
jgi:hypothetical protein